MNNFKMKFSHFVGKIINECWWVHWSNLRWKNAVRNNIGIDEEDMATNYKEVASLVSKLYKKFKWENDGLDELFDSITPPPQNYQYYIDGELKDDCDGFHSLVLHCLMNSGLECYLLSVNAVKSGHCVLVFKSNDKWYLNDYRTVYKGCSTLKECIESYIKIFPSLYNASSEVFYYGLIGYNYDKGKLYNKHVEEIK